MEHENDDDETDDDNETDNENDDGSDNEDENDGGNGTEGYNNTSDVNDDCTIFYSSYFLEKQTCESEDNTGWAIRNGPLAEKFDFVFLWRLCSSERYR